MKQFTTIETENHSVLNDGNFARAIKYLSEKDEDLEEIVKDLGIPPMWNRKPGFPTLLHIILEQQVSLASARAAYNRLLSSVKPLNPENFLKLNDSELLVIGYSRQKTLYSRILAGSILDGSIDLNKIEKMNDSDARSELMKLKGIGRWTADIYLLMALGRPDVMPAGDLALEVALQHVKGLKSRPTGDELQKISNAWRPWRAVAARILWHFYLEKINRKLQ
ncbi:DNA-3-methyladenine glycosylase 2 family protein [candidate division KSB1 bacterium]|nr:DNA-3-methyladenine glycosylase 2 family protein [candidate division KSB1 bacterium]